MLKPATPEAYQLVHDGLLALSAVEAAGIRVDMEYLERTQSTVKNDIRELEDSLRQDHVFKVWRREYGLKTKIGSREQLSEVLFRVLGHPKPGYTEASENLPEAERRFKADAKTFGALDLEFTTNWLRWIQLKDMSSKYLNGIAREVADDGRLHAFFNLHTTKTYRGSADHPNFQNFPIRIAEIAKLVRSCFIASKGHRIVEIDFSGAEVRSAACYNKDPVLIKYLKDPTTDMHRDIAMQLFRLEASQINKKTTRDAAKNMFVFPEFYGSVYFQCAPDIWEAMERRDFRIGSDDEITVRKHLAKQGITRLGDCSPRAEPEKDTFVYRVKKVEEDFWGKRFKVYANWKQKWYGRYRDNAGFNTLTGFRIEGLWNRKEVINYPIQGTAFHWLLWSLIQLEKWMRKNKMRSKIVGQIHDSIVLDVHESELDTVLQKAKQIITVDLPRHWRWINVPIEVEADVAPRGGSWYDKKAVEL